MREVEIKAACTAEAMRTLEEWLLQRDYVGSESYRQEDTYYNHPTRDFRETDEALRLRRVKGETEERAELAYKGPNHAARGQNREEWESRVEDAAAMEAMLQHLGFYPVATVKKTRRTFRNGDISVALDSVEELGSFFEIEILCSGDGAAAATARLAAMMEELRFLSPVEEKKTYLELLQA